MEVAHREMVEAELNRLVEKRSRKGEVDPDEREELWKASLRAHNARRKEQMRAAWAAFHKGQAQCLRRTLEALIRDHEQKASKLMEESDERRTA
jgi:hypothetical protein